MVGNRNDLLELRHITKRFPGVLALEDVDFSMIRGQVHALVGENGAGKSTLIKILCGRYRMDSGEIVIDGEEVDIRSPLDALRLGIGAIQQELNLVGELSVAENIFAGRLPTTSGMRVLWNKLYQDAEKVLQSLGIDLDPRAKMRSLNTGHCKIVEVAKAVSRDIKVLVLDEPTASLPAKEVELLFQLIASLKQRGIGIIYISHHLDEIFQVADVVTVLRNGKNVGKEAADDANRGKIISLMVGRSLGELYPKVEVTLGDGLLQVQSLSKRGQYRDISFTLHRGEILGIFGLIGSGHSSILRTLCGDLVADTGSITIDGKEKRLSSPSVARASGIGIVPPDRKTAGLVLGHEIYRNVSMGSMGHFTHWGMVHKEQEIARARHWIAALDIKAQRPEQKVEDLSGGNQQKVVLARLLEAGVDVLLLDEPTAGVDVGAKVEIYKILESLCWSGKGVILCSTDLREVLAMTDRILVIKNGSVVGEFASKTTTKEQVLQAAL